MIKLKIKIAAISIFLSASVYGQKIKFTEKDYIIKNSDPVQTVTLRIPNSCDEWSGNVKPNINDFIAFSSREESLQKFYEKLKLVTVYSDRLKDITTAQCHINQNSNVIDPNFSDQVFFSDIVKNYFEFQSISNLYLHDLSNDKKDSLKNSVIEIYRAVYKFKKQDLLTLMNDLILNVNAKEPGINVTLKRNENPIKYTVTDSNGKARFVIEKELTVPEPDELIEFTVDIAFIGYASKSFKFGLGELTAKSTDEITLNIDLEKEIIDNNNILLENYEFDKKDIKQLIKKHKKYEN